MNDLHTPSDAACPSAASLADHAAQVIHGEQQTAGFLDRIRSGMAQPDELAVILAYLRGELLHGFCHLVQKALERRHD